MAELEKTLVKGIIRNLNRLVILWLISQKTCTGYEVLKEMRRITSQNLHPGVIYSLLYKLEKSEFIVGDRFQKGRQVVTYYSISDRGRRALNHLRDLFNLPLGPILQDILKKEEQNP